MKKHLNCVFELREAISKPLLAAVTYLNDDARNPEIEVLKWLLLYFKIAFRAVYTVISKKYFQIKI
jgi:hypothetical protein